MKRTTAIILATAFVMPAMADEIGRTVTASPDGEIEISNIAGSVTVSGWSRDEVEVTGELGRNVKELIVERDGDKVTIKVKVPRKSSSRIASDLVIMAPQKSSLDISTVSADITVADISGEQYLSTVSGDIETETAGNDILANAVSGDIEIAGNESRNETDANTVSGDITLFRGSGTVRIESVTGALLVDEGTFGRADLGTVNGEIGFRAGLEQGARFFAETVNGDVEVELAGDVSAKIDIETFNGRIRNCFGPKAERTSEYAPGWELGFTEGGGDGRIDIATMNGSISICNK